MLFGKKDKNGKQDEGKNLKLTSAYHQPQTEEEKMRALESQLDFLRNPNHPDNLKKRRRKKRILPGMKRTRQKVQPEKLPKSRFRGMRQSTLSFPTVLHLRSRHCAVRGH